MLMRTYVFIDGENLRGAIKGVFPQFRGKYLPPADWGEFFRRIVEKAQMPDKIDAVLLKSYWYVVADVDTHPRLPYPDNPEKMMEWKNTNQSRIDSCLHEINQSKSDDKKVSVSTPESLKSFVKQLDDKKRKIEREFRGYRVVQSAIEHQCKSLQFRRSGYIGFDLLDKGGKLGREKTTDVNLALDMLLLKDAYDIAIIVSGDQDFLPAVRAAQAAGKIVLNVAFRAAEGLLPGGAKRLNEAVDWSIEFDSEEFRRLMEAPGYNS